MLLKLSIISAALIVCELIYFKIADRYNIIDKPNMRSSHTHITLRGGGIIFLLGAWLWAAFFGLQYTCFMAGLTAIGLVSLADDIKSVPNSVRLVIQFISMLLMFIDLGLFSADLWWLIIPALIVSVGIINAFNFMDGINGITGTYALAVLIPILYLNHDLHFIDSYFIIVSMISAVIFLFFNFRKRARCFAGDVGSISIAFIVLFALGRLIMATGDITYLLFIGVYGADTILTIVHRIMLHENLGEAHRKHAYQLMSNELHMPHRLVSVIYMLLQLTISFGMIMLNEWHWIYFISVILILASAYILFMRRNYHLHAEYLYSKDLRHET